MKASTVTLVCSAMLLALGCQPPPDEISYNDILGVEPVAQELIPPAGSEETGTDPDLLHVDPVKHDWGKPPPVDSKSVEVVVTERDGHWFQSPSLTAERDWVVLRDPQTGRRWKLTFDRFGTGTWLAGLKQGDTVRLLMLDGRILSVRPNTPQRDRQR